MRKSKTYGQFCALARALDHVGDRWTLLIVRELLVGPRRFAELSAGLPGVAPNLLVDRLRSLQVSGIVERSAHPPRSASVTYELTDLGRGLEQSVHALIRWGAAWMHTGPDGDHVDPRWGAIALKALLDEPSVTEPPGRLGVQIGEEHVVIEIGSHGRRVSVPGPAAGVDARVHCDLPTLLAVTAGTATLPSSSVRVEGDAEFAIAAMTPASQRART
jgi:DNA-binding HxlR family transcriptional regulator